jgi:fatty acyl-CoA reductase
MPVTYRNVHLYYKSIKYVNMMSKFSTKAWKFHDSNIRSLLSSLSPEDRTLFYFDVTRLQWRDYLADYIAGIRLFLLRETTSTLPDARKRYKRYVQRTEGIQIWF